ncbi:MAG TPA: formate dehydrogenase accessory protein FdhE [Gemmatimonadales bacterium]|nr:formate dehydrogenase accessory protein FdhE [Gemmatimonadales bacterium]
MSATAAGSSGLTSAMAIVEALSRGSSAIETTLPAGVPQEQAAEARLASGIPALEGEPLLPPRAMLRNIRTIATALAHTEAGDVAAAISRRLSGAAVARTATDLSVDGLTAAALAGAWDPIHELAPSLDIDAEALVTLLDFAARPALRAGAAALAPLLRPLLEESGWTHGHCPACGAAPTLSVIRGKERERRLHCGRCATAWAFPRVRCPWCGERNHERLHHLHTEGEGEFRRAEVCDSCRTYVKSVALLDAPGDERVLVLDLETTALDFLALEAGYVRTPARA